MISRMITARFLGPLPGTGVNQGFVRRVSSRGETHNKRLVREDAHIVYGHRRWSYYDPQAAPAAAMNNFTRKQPTAFKADVRAYMDM